MTGRSTTCPVSEALSLPLAPRNVSVIADGQVVHEPDKVEHARERLNKELRRRSTSLPSFATAPPLLTFRCCAGEATRRVCRDSALPSIEPLKATARSKRELDQRATIA